MHKNQANSLEWNCNQCEKTASDVPLNDILHRQWSWKKTAMQLYAEPKIKDKNEEK